MRGENIINSIFIRKLNYFFCFLAQKENFKIRKLTQVHIVTRRPRMTINNNAFAIKFCDNHH